MFKRVSAIVLALVLSLSLVSFASADETAKDFGGAELVIATWGWTETSLKTIAADFEAKYNCTIIIDPTTGNGDRLNKLMAEKDAPTADIALLTKSFAETGNAQGLFEKLDTSIVTSLDELYDFAKNAEGYGPCYSLVRYGIMADADALAEAGLEVPTSYQALFSDEYAGMCILPDMTTTAGPYMLVAMAEAMGGSQEDVSAAMTYMQEKKDNVDQWYVTSSDVVTAFTTGEACVTVFMDINMPSLSSAGLNMVWVDAEEGSFAAPATINVVKNCKNPELAQLFVEYMISAETQNNVAAVMNEAPTNMNATVAEDLQAYIAYGAEAMSSLKEFDESYIATAKAEWIDTFQRTVTID